MECSKLGTVLIETFVKVGACTIITEKHLLVWSIQTLRDIDTKEKMSSLLHN